VKRRLGRVLRRRGIGRQLDALRRIHLPIFLRTREWQVRLHKTDAEEKRAGTSSTSTGR
jgi:hypothetical protein